MLLAIAIPIGLTLGAATWALMRGRGGGSGLFLHMLFATIGAFIGGLAAQAMSESDTNATIGIGALVGGVLVAVVEGLVFGPRPKRVSYADRAGVAVNQSESGQPAKTVR
jgi:uncharacterized membrane protein YeaQ/YmgE (transglycosylase-associated protein family)